MNTSPSAKRGLMAAGLGLVLLTGVGGTFAYWTESASLNGGDIASGELGLTVDTANAAWYDCRSGDTTGSVAGCTEIPDITAFKMVPGDIVKYTADTNVTLVGDNIKAEYTSTPATKSGTLADFVTVSTVAAPSATP